MLVGEEKAVGLTVDAKEGESDENLEEAESGIEIEEPPPPLPDPEEIIAQALADAQPL